MSFRRSALPSESQTATACAVILRLDALDRAEGPRELAFRCHKVRTTGVLRPSADGLRMTWEPGAPTSSDISGHFRFSISDFGLNFAAWRLCARWFFRLSRARVRRARTRSACQSLCPWHLRRALNIDRQDPQDVPSTIPRGQILPAFYPVHPAHPCKHLRGPTNAPERPQGGATPRLVCLWHLTPSISRL